MARDHRRAIARQRVTLNTLAKPSGPRGVIETALLPRVQNSKEFALWVCTLDDPTKVTPTCHIFTVEQIALARDCRCIAAL
jgi:hypothetical protein